ncbi:SDR family oxidoreductase [Leifsonia shinshuensis]|uniref:SDR family oxidoreductase n=1 Tax=Leifsonia shinshuensis TaxID=150026 RepID=UPI002866467E|nr:SDR family oxidoreductase [Leifsonia shinshuensis]MDR6971668.1 NAD(P)-dependent dehydrogenase (short-subunit alcohol dehydrogenase family) [Leifsonia shinshuensis]
MKLEHTTAVVTGANRGLGRHIARQLRDRGANVFAGARNPDSVDLAGVTPLRLDITYPASVAAAASVGNAAILVNNAGVVTGSSLLGGELAHIRHEFETNFFGTLSVTRAFAPQLGEHAESYVLNILSAYSWLNVPFIGGYSASKAAEWSLTDGLRQDLAGQGTRVGGLYVALMDTDFSRVFDAPKEDPADVARLAVDAIENREFEVFADEESRSIRAGLPGGVEALYPSLSHASLSQASLSQEDQAR